MFKLANQVLDQYDDISREGLVKIAKLNSQIYLMTPEEHVKLADDDFALSIITKKASKLNKFPIDSYDNTWLSNQYFSMNHTKLASKAASTAAYFIKQACDQFDIKTTPPVEALAKEASSNIYYEEEYRVPVKTTSTDLTKFAEVQQIGDNYTVAQYTFATPGHLKVASKYFEDFHQDMPMEYRHKYAAAIQKRAHELGLPPVGGKVAKYASDHYSAHLDAHLRSRVSLLKFANPNMANAFEKLASLKKEAAPHEFAQALHQLDKRAGLDKYYGGYLTDPYLSTFAGQAPNPYSGWKMKTASGTLNADEVAQVATKKYAQIKDLLGPQVADELKKHGAAIFESLPKPAQEAIVEMFNGAV